MKQAWLPYALKSAPRYTSYPTAVQFHDGVDAETVEGWARSINPEDAISVYVHVPFCEKLCWYCGCHTTIPNGYRRIADYHEVLQTEIDLWANRLGPHAGAKHVHFGGGTPNALSADDLRHTLTTLRRAFKVREDAEIAAELDPRTLNGDRLRALANGGLTRASLGVQDFDETVQTAINRVQPYALVKAATEALRGEGIEGISFDLMYGLPHQTTGSVIETAKQASGLSPDRISVFGYAHVPWFAKHQKAIDDAALPGVEARFEQNEVIRETLVAEGYIAIGLDHFARPDDPLALAADAHTLRRNFQGYTDDPCETLIALGPSGISAFRDGYAQNEKSTLSWTNAVQAGQLPIARGVEITDEDRLRARAIETLMCDMQIDLAAVCLEQGVCASALDGSLPVFNALATDGLCKISGRHITVPDDARAFLRTVAQALDTYSPAIPADTQRHAQAV